MEYYTNYATAVHWLHNNIILCNEIFPLDESVIDNARFSWFNDDDDPIEIYQYYITDCDTSDVEFLEEHFKLKFSYSEMLEKYILCVDHFGTAWDYVTCTADFPQAERKLGETD